MTKRALTSAVILLIAPAAVAEELHVGAGQTYAEVQAAVDAAAPGDAILVHAGSYAEDVDATTDGGSSARITLRSAGDGAVTITGRITLDGDYWEVRDLALVARAGARGVRIRGNYNRLVGIELSGGDRDGINGSGTGNEVRDSHIHDFDAGSSDAHCIVLNPGAEDWIIRGNDLHDCSGDALQLYADAAERSIKNLLLENNLMYFTGSVSRTENALDVKNGDGLVIRGNTMWGFPDNKVVVFQKGPANIEMSCNVMYNGFSGVEFRGEDGGTVESVTFTRNLVHGFASYALKFDGTVGADVYNNTFVDIGSDGLRIEGAGLDTGNVRNNLWVDAGNVESGAFMASHNGYFNATTDIGSGDDVTGDPLLDEMYALGAGSPMIDVGLDVGLPFAGDSPDIGFDETALDACARSTGGGGSGPGVGGGGASASSSSSSSGGEAGEGGAGAVEADDSSNDGSCSCAAPGHKDETPPALLLLMGAALLSRRCVGGG